jgi:competence protein ComEC
MLVAATCVLYKMRSLLLPACCGMVLLMGWQWLHWWPSQQQRKMIVYNIARTAAAEIVTGNTSWFRGDAAVVNSIPLQKNYLLPAHTCWQVTGTHVIQHAIYHCGGKRICFFTPALAASGTVPVDILIVSGSPDIAITQLQERFPCRQLVFDSSNPLWKIQKWKKDCDSLHLRFHSVPEQGAFITDL